MANSGSNQVPIPKAPEPETEMIKESNNGLHPAQEVLFKIGLAGISNSGAAVFTNPADLVKVRQQLESTGAADKATWKSRRFGQVLQTMIRQEGLMSVYKGLSASVVREASYSGLRMGLYDIIKSGLVKTASSSSTSSSSSQKEIANSGSIKLGAGMLSGMLGAAVANPADLIKVRMQAPAAVKQSFLGHARDICRERGVAGLYRAVLPTTIRAGLLTSTQVGVYDITKYELIQKFGFQERFSTHFLSSAIAGIACTLSSSPVDVVKVRLMNDKKQEFRNALHCAGVVLKREGPLAFYKGGFMCWIRLWPHTVISLSLFERLRSLAGLDAI